MQAFEASYATSKRLTTMQICIISGLRMQHLYQTSSIQYIHSSFKKSCFRWTVNVFGIWEFMSKYVWKCYGQCDLWMGKTKNQREHSFSSVWLKRAQKYPECYFLTLWNLLEKSTKKNLLFIVYKYLKITWNKWKMNEKLVNQIKFWYFNITERIIDF